MEITDVLKNSEWVVAYIHAPWCKVCEGNKEVVQEVINESPDITIVQLDATHQENETLLRALDFESLPYYAVFHTAKEGADPEDPTTCFVGGETGGGKDIPNQIVTMIRQFRAQQVVA
jgi:thiol:disulfide interchange protein